MPRKLAPARKVNDLIQHLANLSEAPAIDEFSLQRIDRDAKSLMQSDPVGAHTLLGGTAALRSNADETRHHFRAALGIEQTLVPLFNYSIALSILEEHSEAFDVTTEALKKYPDDLRLLNQGIMVALESANFLCARDLCDRWDALAPDQSNHLSDSARQLALAVEAGTFGEQGVREILRLVAATQRSEDVRTSSIGISSYDDADSFLYQRLVYADPSLAATLNERLADRIAERSDLMADPGLSFVAVFTGVTPDGRNA